MKFKTEAKLIKQYRENAGLTQGEVALKLGYTNSQFISNWERNLSGVPDRMIPDLCKAIGMPVNVLLNAKLQDRRQELERATGVRFKLKELS